MSSIDPVHPIGLGGTVPRSDPLSSAQTVNQLKPLAAWLARASDDDLWRQDTDRLPAPLARLRTRGKLCWMPNAHWGRNCPI